MYSGFSSVPWSDQKVGEAGAQGVALSRVVELENSSCSSPNSARISVWRGFWWGLGWVGRCNLLMDPFSGEGFYLLGGDSAKVTLRRDGRLGGGGGGVGTDIAGDAPSLTIRPGCGNCCASSPDRSSPSCRLRWLERSTKKQTKRKSSIFDENLMNRPVCQIWEYLVWNNFYALKKFFGKNFPVKLNSYDVSYKISCEISYKISYEILNKILYGILDEISYEILHEILYEILGDIVNEILHEILHEITRFYMRS